MIFADLDDISSSLLSFVISAFALGIAMPLVACVLRAPIIFLKKLGISRIKSSRLFSEALLFFEGVLIVLTFYLVCYTRLDGMLNIYCAIVFICAYSISRFMISVPFVMLFSFAQSFFFGIMVIPLKFVTDVLYRLLLRVTLGNELIATNSVGDESKICKFYREKADKK